MTSFDPFGDHTTEPFNREDLIRATGNARKRLAKGQRIRIRVDMTDKKWLTFEKWNGPWVTCTDGSEHHAIFIDRLNTEKVCFKKGAWT